jgi:hypothetical protein
MQETGDTFYRRVRFPFSSWVQPPQFCERPSCTMVHCRIALALDELVR